MNKTARALFALVALMLLCGALCGCDAIGNGVIKENPGEEHIPDVDPQAGVARDMKVKLFYRLTDEPYLVGVTGTVTVLSGERPEKAIVRALIAGTPPLSNNISPLFPDGTAVADAALDGAILYVTLSGDFFSTTLVDEAVADGTRLLNSSLIGRAEYEKRVDAAREEMFQRRRLAVASIANSVADYNPGARVQLLFERGGAAVRVTRAELGLEGHSQNGNDLLEPIGPDDTLLATPEIVTECALKRISRGEYEKAYDLVAETESGGAQKPDYANFETELAAFGTLTAYTVKGSAISEDNAYAYVTVDVLVRESGSGRDRRQRNVSLTLKNEGNIYKIGYRSLIAILGGTAS